MNTVWAGTSRRPSDPKSGLASTAIHAIAAQVREQ